MENNYTAPGPIFEPGPGWGGKLKKWSKKYILGWDCSLCRATRFVLIFGIIFLILAGPEINNQERAEVEEKTVVETVQPRDGQTHLARRLLAKFLEHNKEISLTGGQKIFIENTLSEKVPDALLVVGQNVSLDLKEITSAIEEAKLLSLSQLQRWEKYAERVKNK